MASTSTGNAVPLALGHRDRCGSGGGADAGHASLRAFAVAHAAFDTPSQLGGDPNSRLLAQVPAPTPGSSVFVFGSKCSSCGAAGCEDKESSGCSGEKAREPAACCGAAGEISSSPFAAAALKPRAAAREGAPRRCPAAEPSATVFGPSAPRERKTEPVVAPIAPKRAREVPAMDDVVTLLERCVASDDLDDVDRAAELLSGCCVPGKRPRTAETSSTVSSTTDVAARQKLRDPEVDAVQAKAAIASTGDSAARVSDDASPNAMTSSAAARSTPAHDTCAGADIEKHDDDELSFLVTRCDIDSGNRTELFMPYIS